MGKSSLFNRILGRRAAVVSDREGVTRDRHYQDVSIQGRSFRIIDTGGFLPDDKLDALAESVRGQIFTAVQEADLVLFMVDARVGVAASDREFAKLVQRSGKSVLLVANKAEKESERADHWEFLKLGLGEPRMISALAGTGFRALMDEVLSILPKHRVRTEEEAAIRFAVLGRPNAGKSTLLNRLMGEERLIVSDIPGTTRDSIDCEFRWEGHRFVVTDTAGLRKKARVSDEVEYFSNMRSLESVRRAHLAVLVIDATRGMEIQDFRILQQVRQSDKGMIIALNKWDALPEKDHRSFDQIVKHLREKDPHLAFVPIVSISALEGQRVHRLLQEVVAVHANCRRVLGRERLTEVFQQAVQNNPHPARQTRPILLKRACQTLVDPVVVTVEVNNPELVDESWKRYFTKVLHEEFALSGAPVKLNFDEELHLRKDEDLELHT